MSTSEGVKETAVGSSTSSSAIRKEPEGQGAVEITATPGITHQDRGLTPAAEIIKKAGDGETMEHPRYDQKLPPVTATASPPVVESKSVPKPSVEDGDMVRTGLCSGGTAAGDTWILPQTSLPVERVMPSSHSIDATAHPDLASIEGLGIEDRIVRYNPTIPVPSEIVSPFKECFSNEKHEDILARTIQVSSNRENAYIVSLPITHRQNALNNFLTYDSSTIAKICVMRRNCAGIPLNSSEFPVLASPHPPETASYYNAVLGRYNGSTIDMRFRIICNKSDEIRETYLLGRLWTPLWNIRIQWYYLSSNFDHSTVKIQECFAEVGSREHVSDKNLAKLTGALGFFEDNRTIGAGKEFANLLEYVNKSKLSMSRLFWRIWALYYEACFQEEYLKRPMHVYSVYNSEAPIGHYSLANFVNMSGHKITTGEIMPFFLPLHLINHCPGIPAVKLMNLLLCERFDAHIIFGINKNWPPLGKIKLYIPGDATSEYHDLDHLTVESHVLKKLGQVLASLCQMERLFEEIGITVAQFLYRPEGDSAWFGHSEIQVGLPPFRCARTLHFAWADTSVLGVYHYAQAPLYKAAWHGAISYFLQSLAVNAVLCENNIFTFIQLENHGVKASKYMRELWLSLMSYNDSRLRLINRAQHVGIRFGWGNIFNRITGGIRFVRPDGRKFTRILQWAEWALFSTVFGENSFLPAMMTPMRTDYSPTAGIRYRPTVVGNITASTDALYRLFMADIGEIGLKVYGPLDSAQFIENIPALAGPTGYPLDGQYRDIQVSRTHNADWYFTVVDVADINDLYIGWPRRMECLWSLNAPRESIDRLESYFEDEDRTVENQMAITGESRAPPSVDYKYILESMLHTTPGPKIINFGSEGKITFCVDAGDEEADADLNECMAAPAVAATRAVFADADTFDQPTIHYCRRKKEPSIGERMRKYGLRPIRSTCGVNNMAYVSADRTPPRMHTAESEYANWRARNKQPRLKKSKMIAESSKTETAATTATSTVATTTVVATPGVRPDKAPYLRHKCVEPIPTTILKTTGIWDVVLQAYEEYVLRSTNRGDNLTKDQIKIFKREPLWMHVVQIARNLRIGKPNADQNPEEAFSSFVELIKSHKITDYVKPLPACATSAWCQGMYKVCYNLASRYKRNASSQSPLLFEFAEKCATLEKFMDILPNAFQPEAMDFIPQLNPDNQEEFFQKMYDISNLNDFYSLTHCYNAELQAGFWDALMGRTVEFTEQDLSSIDEMLAELDQEIAAEATTSAVTTAATAPGQTYSMSTTNPIPASDQLPSSKGEITPQSASSSGGASSCGAAFSQSRDTKSETFHEKKGWNAVASQTPWPIQGGTCAECNLQGFHAASCPWYSARAVTSAQSVPAHSGGGVSTAPAAHTTAQATTEAVSLPPTTNEFYRSREIETASTKVSSSTPQVTTSHTSSMASVEAQSATSNSSSTSEESVGVESSCRSTSESAQTSLVEFPFQPELQ
nr:MAG: hypothetical protein [Totiviridae sp.]